MNLVRVVKQTINRMKKTKTKKGVWRSEWKRMAERKLVSITIIAITIALYLSHLMCSLPNNVRQRLNYQRSIHCFLPSASIVHTANVQQVFFFCFFLKFILFAVDKKRNCFNCVCFFGWLVGRYTVISLEYHFWFMCVCVETRFLFLFHLVISLFWNKNKKS